MYTREQEKKDFHTSPIITKNDWMQGATYASDDARNRVIPHSESVLYIISQKEHEDSKNNLTSNENITDFLKQMLLVKTFDEYVDNMHQRVYEVNFADKWIDSTCTCPYFMKKLICKHIIGIALVRDYI